MKHNFCVLQGYIACWSNGPTRDQKEQFFISFKYAIHEKGLLAPIPEQRTSCSVLQRTGRYSKLLKVLDAFWLRNWFYPLDWKIICRFQPGLQTHHSLLEPYIINYYRWYRKKSIFLLLPGLNWVSFGWNWVFCSEYHMYICHCLESGSICHIFSQSRNCPWLYMDLDKQFQSRLVCWADA